MTQAVASPDFVMLSEAELPLAEAQRVEAPLCPKELLRSARVRGRYRGPSTWFFFASEEEQALRMTSFVFFLSKCTCEQIGQD
jgi:hypothetical protein